MSGIKSLDDLYFWLCKEIDRYVAEPSDIHTHYTSAYLNVMKKVNRLRCPLAANPPAVGPWQTGEPPKNRSLIGQWDDKKPRLVVTKWDEGNDSWRISPWLARTTPPDRWAEINLSGEDTSDFSRVEEVDEPADEVEITANTKHYEGTSYTWGDAYENVRKEFETVLNLSRYLLERPRLFDVMDWALSVMKEQQVEE